MAILSGGTRHDPLRGFKFRVTLYPPATVNSGSKITIGCQRVSGLREETEQVEYRDGDELGSVRKIPGLTTYDNVVLERGQLLVDAGQRGSSVLLDWRQQIATLYTDGDSLTEEDLRGRMSVEVFPRGGGAVGNNSAPAFEYYFDAVWPAIYEHSDLDGTASDVWFERVEMAVERAGMTLSPS